MFVKNNSGQIVTGRIIRDPEQKTFDSGKTKTSFAVLYGEDKNQLDENGKPRGLFLNIDCWGAVGRDACLLGKGDFVIAQGRIDSHEYNGKMYTSLVADAIWCDMSATIRMLAGSAGSAGTTASGGGTAAPDPFTAFGSGDDGDLPF